MAQGGSQSEGFSGREGGEEGGGEEEIACRAFCARSYDS